MSKPQKVHPLDHFLYEARPVSLLYMAAYSIVFPQNIIMMVAGILLLFSTALIVRLRLKHRGYITW